MDRGIIIPCYNEAKRLRLDEFTSFLDTHKNHLICFVNDGSSDNTLEVLNRFQKTNPKQIYIYDMPKNGGKAAAVRAGVKYMLRATQVQSIGFLDADLATGFDDYLHLEKTLKNEKARFVLGSRKLIQNNDIQRSFLRNVFSKTMGMFIRSIIGMDIKDTQCGAKVFDRYCAEVIFEDAFISKWLFDVEMLLRVKQMYQTNVLDFVKEVAIKKWDEVEGSHISLKDSLKFPIKLIEIAFAYKFKPVFAPKTFTINKPVAKAA